MRALLQLAAGAAAAAAAFIPASDPGFTYIGRFEELPDGTKAFDWEGSSVYLTVQNASYIAMNMNSTGTTGRFITYIYENADLGSPMPASNVWVGPQAGPESQTYTIVSSMGRDVVYTVRIFLDNEPSFTGASPTAFFQFAGIQTDGSLLPPPTFARHIEIVGDSITVGYGSNGGGPCAVNAVSSSHWVDYSQQLCRNFSAACSTVAWSGKGMYQNCCDAGTKMPQYYLQTRGGEANTSSWNFTGFTPDAMIINLGTNDFGHDSGAAWEAAFSQTYADFVANATTRYGKPKLPIFVAQGPMNDSPALYSALQVAISAINAAGGAAHFLDMRGPPNDGCGGHPGIKGHAGMFAMAQPQIAAVMGW